MRSIHWDIQNEAELSSTQDLCKQRAAEGAAEGLVVRALRQTQGRGRQGRSWVFEDGNLAVSLILRPEADVRQIGQLSILIGVGVAQAIAAFCPGGHVQLKWPNDVLLGGKKCAGILIDSDLTGSRMNWLVVGVGVNTGSAPEIGAALGVDAEAFLEKLLEQVDILYTAWKAEGFENIRRYWLENTYSKGAQLNVGTFHDLDENGNLVVLDAAGGLKTVSAGDVHLKDEPYVTGD